MSDQVGVRWTLGALAGVRVDVVAGWTRDTGGARRLGAHGARPAFRRHTVNGITDCDGVDSGHIINIPTHLSETTVDTTQQVICQNFLILF